ncbi:Flp/Fap pilin component [Aquisphaera giovannonii]|uniref:Flp/Fap pilin component n=1 Tax=Aquisphaera giovannonii TaxID=406548 RepID=A0A5B9WC60_9BACT|nr:Flp family type IVb pilin [Aquisphaera giovannonii]QEH37635.1 Flp/Fap pilin component [Aquisphaera giovannonii]
MHRLLGRLRREEAGATAVEYAVLLALILVAVMTAINALGSTSSGIWANDTTNITSSIGGS